MSFSVEIVFTGLCFFCLGNQGNPTCKDSTSVYLVNATKEATVCGEKLELTHEPQLSFGAEYLGSPDTKECDLVPRPDGGHAVLCDLAGRDLCISVSGPSSNSVPTLQGSRSRGQEHPLWYRADAHAFGWIAGIYSTDQRVQEHGLCVKTMNGDLENNELVISRVRLSGGELSTDSLARYPNKNYMAWELTYPKNEALPHDFPKALPDHVVWKLGNLPSTSTVQLYECGSSRQKPWFTLDSKGQDIQIQISNSPTKFPPGASGLALDHFRWFYRLVNWADAENGACDLQKDLCPADVSVPAITAANLTRMAKKDWEDMLLIETVHCPPAAGN